MPNPRGWVASATKNIFLRQKEHCSNIPMDWSTTPWKWLIEKNLVNVIEDRLSTLCCWEATVQPMINRGKRTLRWRRNRSQVIRRFVCWFRNAGEWCVWNTISILSQTQKQRSQIYGLSSYFPRHGRKFVCDWVFQVGSWSIRHRSYEESLVIWHDSILCYCNHNL